MSADKGREFDWAEGRMSAGNGREFDWAEDKGDVIIEEQMAVAVYPGELGVVVRQRADWSREDDDVILFPNQMAPAIAKAILTAAGFDATALAPELTQVGGKPKDSTTTERH